MRIRIHFSRKHSVSVDVPTGLTRYDYAMIVMDEAVKSVTPEDPGTDVFGFLKFRCDDLIRLETETDPEFLFIPKDVVKHLLHNRRK